MFYSLAKVFLVSIFITVAFSFISPGFNAIITEKLTSLLSNVWALDSFVNISQLFEMLRYFMIIQVGMFTILIYKLFLPGKNA